MLLGTEAIAEFLLVAVSAGLLGTLAMSAVIYLAPKSLVGNIGLVSAIGSIFTGGGFQSARTIGTLVHISAGIAFATLYCLGFGILGIQSVPLSVVGGLFGLAHGFVLFFILIPLLAEHHPVKSIREAGGGIGFAYLVAHIIFGLVVGGVASLLGAFPAA